MWVLYFASWGVITKFYLAAQLLIFYTWVIHSHLCNSLLFALLLVYINSLGFNRIGDEGAIALADALQVNHTLTILK